MLKTAARYWEKAQRGGASAPIAVVACGGGRAESASKSKCLKTRNVAGGGVIVNIA